MTARRPASSSLANGLHWLHGEISRSLERVRAALEAYHEAGSGDPRPLLGAAADLNQVSGAVAMVQCFGATIVADEMQVVLKAALAGQLRDPPAAFTALSAAAFQLSDYVELLATGEPDCAVVLQSAINELRVARDAPLLDETALFARQAEPLVMAADAAVTQAPQRETSDVSALARDGLVAYQRHFVAWFKGQETVHAMAGMNTLAERVAAAAQTAAVRRLWWAFTLLLESQDEPGGNVPLELKRLVGRSSVELQRLAQQGEAGVADSAAPLSMQVLYWLVRASRPSARARQLVDATRLASLLPDAATLARARQRLRAPNSGVLARVEAELRRDLQAVEDSIDLAVRTHGRAGAALEGTLARLRSVGDTLGVLGLPQLRHVLHNQAALIPTLAIDAPQWMDVATALVRVQSVLGGVLSGAGGGAPPATGSVDAVPAQAADVALFAKAALVDCGHVETALVAYASDRDARHLAELSTRVSKLVDGLRVAGLERAAGQLAVVRRYAERGCVAPAGDAAATRRLAEAFSAVELYLEALRDRVPAPDVLLARISECVAPLAAALDAQPAADATPPLVVPTPAVAASDPQRPATEEAVDPEIREIFLAEAGEVVTAVTRAVRRLKHDPQDTEALTEVRRGFHTLKGSGRVVGAAGIGEFAWAVEQLLNRCLAGALAVRAPVLNVTEQAIALVPRLCEALEAGDAAAVAVPEACVLAARADELRTEDSSAGADLYAIFRDDARGRLAFVRNWLAGCDTQADAEIEPEIVRAFHTLRGSAAVAQAAPVQRVAKAVEGWLGHLRQSGSLLDGAGVALLGDVSEAFERWIGTSELEHAATSESDALAARVEVLHGSLAATAADGAGERDAYTIAALEAVQGLEAGVRAWCELPRLGRGAELGVECARFGERAAACGYPVLSEVSTALAARLGTVVEIPSPALLPALEDIFESFYQRLDAIRDGACEADSAALLDRIAGLPIASAGAPRDRLAPVVPATPQAVPSETAELHAIFLEEARELLDECRTALNALAAAGPDAAPALDRVRRALHTLKGSARMVGEREIGAVAARAHRRLVTADDEAVTGEASLPPLRADCDELEQLWMRAGGTARPPPSPDAASVTVNAAAPDPGLLEVFVPEAAELLETLDTAVARWEDPDSAAAARRALHTLKGSARVAGLDVVGDAAHALETELGAADDVAARHWLQAGVERLHVMYDALRRGDITALQRHASGAAPRSTPWTGDLLWQPADEGLDESGTRREYARVPVDALDRMLGATGEVGTQRARLVAHNAGVRAQLVEMERTVERVRTQLRLLVAETDAQIAARGLNPDSAAASGRDDRYAKEFDPLEMDRYSRMQELSRTLVEAVDDLAALHTTMDRNVTETETLLGQQEQITATVQQDLMDTLLVPFSREQGRLERVVRQTAHETGKSAVLQVANGDIELDRKVLQRIVGPLEHLLRNAVVHGIELPAARSAAGKVVEGRVDIHLRREAAQVLVEVSDDGRGLDLAAIRRKAVERGLVAADATPGAEELGRLIFEPGFSTAATLTQEAGRGIGLDVVASAVRQLGGSVELRARPGAALTFALRLPLSMAMSRALLVRAGTERYMLPLASIAGVVRIPSAELPARLQDGGAPVSYGGEGYRVHYLGDFLGVPRPAQAVEARSAIAILARAGEALGGEPRRVALVVDELLGTQEVLAKVAGPQLAAVRGVAGAATLPDGGVAVTLDIASLVAGRVRAPQPAAVPAAAPRATIMVVDDSVTMRRIAERLLTRNGFRVVTARDGLVAMDLLRDEAPAVVLLDIEMPRADGFEVAAFIRHDERIRHTPIIMITSRSGEKHRERARRLGVERYLVKPYREEQLLAEIAALSSVAAEVAS